MKTLIIAISLIASSNVFAQNYGFGNPYLEARDREHARRVQELEDGAARMRAIDSNDMQAQSLRLQQQQARPTACSWQGSQFICSQQ